MVGSDVTDLEEPCTRSKGKRVIESGRAGIGGGAPWCTVGILSSKSAPEEPMTAAEKG